MNRDLVSALVFSLVLPFTLLAEEPRVSGPQPPVGANAPATMPVRSGTKEAVGVPGLFSTEIDLAANPSLAQYRKKMEDRGIPVLDATPVEGGGLTRIVLYVANREQLGQAQYDLNSRLSPSELPRPADARLDTDYNRLLQTSERAVYARLYYDTAISENGKIQEGFQTFKQQVNALSVQFTAVLDADGKKVAATRANRSGQTQYTLPFQGSIVYLIKDLRDAYRFQIMVSGCSIAERVELIEPQQQAAQGQPTRGGFQGQNGAPNLSGQYPNGNAQSPLYGNAGYQNGNYSQPNGNPYYDQSQLGLSTGYGQQQSLGNGVYGPTQPGFGNGWNSQSIPGMQQGFGNTGNPYGNGRPPSYRW